MQAGQDKFWEYQRQSDRYVASADISDEQLDYSTLPVIFYSRFLEFTFSTNLSVLQDWA